MVFALTTLHVKDLDESVRYYTENFGMPVIARFPAGDHEIAMLGEAGHAHLELIGDGTGDVDSSQFSIGFYVDDAGTLAKRLDEGFVGPISPNPHIRFFFVRDPDGYSVEIIEELD